VLAEALVPFQLNGESSASPEQIEQYRELLQSAKEDFTKLPKLQSDALILHAFYDLNARKVARVLSRMGSTKIFTVAEVEELLTSARAFLNAKRIERENKDSSE
jgi:DNA-directed RNA polymerase specialized sigma24 family protein